MSSIFDVILIISIVLLSACTVHTGCGPCCHEAMLTVMAHPQAKIRTGMMWAEKDNFYYLQLHSQAVINNKCYVIDKEVPCVYMMGVREQTIDEYVKFFGLK
jgi:hypothetical protein